MSSAEVVTLLDRGDSDHAKAQAADRKTEPTYNRPSMLGL